MRSEGAPAADRRHHRQFTEEKKLHDAIAFALARHSCTLAAGILCTKTFPLRPPTIPALWGTASLTEGGCVPKRERALQTHPVCNAPPFRPNQGSHRAKHTPSIRAGGPRLGNQALTFEREGRGGMTDLESVSVRTPWAGNSSSCGPAALEGLHVESSAQWKLAAKNALTLQSATLPD